MRLLLDTHIAFWVIADPAKLPPRARDLIENASAVFVSPISVLEIAIKNKLGRRGQAFGISAELAAKRFEDAGLIWLPVEHGQAAHVETMPLLHADPFDRLMVAQAVVESLRFVTHDSKLTVYHPSIILV